MAYNNIKEITYEYTSGDSKTNRLMVQYKRTYGKPFDISSVFGSKEGVLNYAKGNLSYAGQVVSTVDSAKTDVYKINYNGDIEKLLSENELDIISADTRFERLETNSHNHGNKNILDNISNDKVSKWDAANSYTDTKVSGVTKTIFDLIGTDSGKTVRNIAAEEVAKIVADAPESYNTLKEIADWIQNDTTGSVKMANDIEGLKKEDVTIDGRLDALEAISGQSHVHDNKALLDTYTQTETDLADAVAKKHKHTNKEVLDGISSEKIAAWNVAEQNAKDYADAEIAELSEIYDAKGAAATAEQNAKDYADDLSANYDAAGAADEVKEWAEKQFSKDKIKINNAYDSTYYLIGSKEVANDSLYLNDVTLMNSVKVYSNGSNLYTTSDENLKNFINDIHVDLNELKNIPKKYFTWKNDDYLVNIGTSAQKLQEVYPELVTIDPNGNLGVAYDKLSVIALAAIDKLHQENIDLKERLRKIEEKLNL